jgi:hypothetical protein
MRDAITTAGEVVGLLLIVAAVAVAANSLVTFLAAGGAVLFAACLHEGRK